MATVLNFKVIHIINFISIKLEINENILKENIIPTTQFLPNNNKVKENNESYNHSLFWKEMKILIIKSYQLGIE